MQWSIIGSDMPSALGLVIDYESLTMIFTGNMWSILPWRLGDGKNQVHKGRELSMFLMLVGLNITGHMIATSLVMASDGQPLVPHNMTAAIVKDVMNYNENLLTGKTATTTYIGLSSKTRLLKISYEKSC